MTESQQQTAPQNPLQDEIAALVNLYQSGQLMQAEQTCRELLKTYPQSLAVMNVLGAALSAQGKLEESVQVYDKAIQIRPDSAELYFNRGNALKAMGQLTEAVQSYERVIQLKPDNAEAHNNRGNALKAMGQLNKAVQSYERAIQLKPEYADACFNKGNTLKEMGQLNKAVQSYERVIKLKPEYVDAYFNRGNALLELDKPDEAVSNYDKAIKLRPEYAEAYNNRGHALKLVKRIEEAVASIDYAIELKPDLAEAYSNLGNILIGLGRADEAVRNYNKAIQLRPDLAEVYANRGNALKELGQLDEAMSSYGKAIQLKPGYAKGHRDLSLLKKYASNDPQIGLMESLFIDSDLNESDRMHLYFALGKAFGDVGEYDKSFNYLEKGNNLRNKTLNYNINEDVKLFARIKEVFCRESLTLEDNPDGNLPIQPLFIVGAPRSGTSLVEQILASHTKVHGAGELTAIEELMLPIMMGQAGQNKRYEKTRLFLNEIGAIRNSYTETLTALKVSESIITDKMPLNFRWVGFILSAFPNAKIVHLKRDPRATCWSIYKNYFSSGGNGYAYDMDNLAKFYNLYTDLMSFWRELFPTNIYDLCYEDLTENQEEETRGLLNFCSLEWEEECLDFHKTKRVVGTASAAQVREKIYTGSSEVWRRYENHLQPLITALHL